jgi:conjugal transfer mating pair stabilization protein TraN
MSCCKVGADGWGETLGAECSADERALQKKRAKGLCEYTGKTTTGTSPFHVNKHHFCCFGNLFNKVFQVEARKQLFKGRERKRLFGTGESPECRGITIEEIMQLDFEKMDFSEFANEIKKNIKMPNVSDIEARVKETFSPIETKGKKLEEEEKPEDNPATKKAGVSDEALKQFEDESEY